MSGHFDGRDPTYCDVRLSTKKAADAPGCGQTPRTCQIAYRPPDPACELSVRNPHVDRCSATSSCPTCSSRTAPSSTTRSLEKRAVAGVSGGLVRVRDAALAGGDRCPGGMPARACHFRWISRFLAITARSAAYRRPLATQDALVAMLPSLTAHAPSAALTELAPLFCNARRLSRPPSRWPTHWRSGVIWFACYAPDPVAAPSLNVIAPGWNPPAPAAVGRGSGMMTALARFLPP